ncbi:MAG: HU family DNA-binding protein [Planctomycetia bacterium]|nr:HU family DNA-binding protein [Planctomycetia bacterium]
MTKKEIVKSISDKLGHTQLNTKKTVQMVFDAIIDTLVVEGRIELRNFGVFEIKKRKARKARNPRTGDKVSVPEKFVVTFKPGKQMEERVEKLRDCLDQLSAGDLQIIVWHWFDRLNDKDVSKKLSIPVAEAEERYRRAQEGLHAQLAKMGLTGSLAGDEDDEPAGSESLATQSGVHGAGG